MPTNHRRTRRDWIEAAYAALARDGERGITVNGLAARLGVTKGSFYWHFPDRAALVQALLDRWAYERTDELLAVDLGGTGPADRLRRMHELGREVAPIDRAMRLWAENDPKVAEAVRHADESLIGHLTAILGELGFPPDDAGLRAVMMLRVTVGGYFVASTANTGPDGFERSLGLFLAGRSEASDHP
ncbi:TetR/AcrR family transcriptional regulator [Actinomadura scrupuli]|uniref:TetR/AcrR family transcriptional regulator n=1 Tax=Actinomadura scrupuli TaxID=559629 RepID=UPI003D9894B6